MIYFVLHVLNFEFRVFYNPNNPGEITSLGEIWIYKAAIMWSSLCVLMGIPGVCSIFYDAWGEYLLPGNHFPADWSSCEIVTRGIFIFLACLIIFSFGSLCGILACEIIFFSPLALGMF